MAANPEPEEILEVEPSSDALATISKAEIDIQIATAKKYPRSIQAFQRDILTLATADQETARSMFYVVPRDGKTIEGASVRLAEAAASCWGNAHFGARIISIDDQFVTAQAVAWDMEKNYRVGIEVRRRITNKYGKRYSDDMIVTTSNAAQSIAFRNAVFKVVPAALTKKAYLQAKQVSLGKDMTMEQRRKRAFEAMAKVGAKAADVFRLMKCKGEEDLTVDDLINLNGIYTAIQDGDTTWAEVLAGMADDGSAPDDLPKAANTDKKKGAKDSASVQAQGTDGAGSSPGPSAPQADKPKDPEPEPEPPPPDDAAIGIEAGDEQFAQARSLGLRPMAIQNVLQAKFGLIDASQLKMSQIPAFMQACAEAAAK